MTFYVENETDKEFGFSEEEIVVLVANSFIIFCFLL